MVMTADKIKRARLGRGSGVRRVDSVPFTPAAAWPRTAPGASSTAAATGATRAASCP